MSIDEPTPEMEEAPVDTDVIERMSELTGVDETELANALVVLNANLLGHHAELERDYDYVTVDRTRAYRVADEEWNSLLDGVALDGELGEAVRLAHTEQAQLLFASAVGADDLFRDEQAGVVIGVETAEEF